MKYFVGCAGWRYGSWAAGFYPATLDPKYYLAYYSRVFDLAAVAVQAVPQKGVLERWASETPDGFKFIVKIPGQAIDSGLGKFLEGLAPIEEKVLAVLLQVPSTLSLAEGRNWLDSALEKCVYHGYSAAVEFDHTSWFQDMAYNILSRHGAALVWSDRHLQPITTSDFVCVQLTGSSNEKAWIEKTKEERQLLDFAAIITESPAKANEVLKMLGLPEKKYAGPIPAPALSYREPWSGSRVVMCVDLNAFYPSCEELREPSLKGRAHAVIMTDQEKDRITKGVVSSCSYEARKFGVRSAMPLARALALHPGLVLRPVDMQYYREVSEKVMGVIEQYADVLEQASIDEAFLDCTKSGSADAHEYADRIKQVVKERCGLSVSIGVAPNKSAAKMASDFKKPDGLTVVHPGQLKDFLAPLEVGRISGIGPKTQQVLKKIGIETIGQLAACDVQKLTEKFGRNGLWMWKVANGTEDEPVEPREESVSLSTEHTLEEFTKDRNTIQARLSGLVGEIHGRVARHGYMFRTVGVKLVRTDFTIETREKSFQELQSGRDSISSVIEQLLDKFSLDDSTLAVRKVGLRVTNLVPIQEDKPQKTILDFM